MAAQAIAGWSESSFLAVFENLGVSCLALLQMTRCTHLQALVYRYTGSKLRYPALSLFNSIPLKPNLLCLLLLAGI